MATSVKITAIRPKQLKVKEFNNAVERALDKAAKLLDKDFNITMTTFKRKFPVRTKKGKYWRLVWVDNEIYGYLSHGTRIRWALMSRDWRSKTAPGRFKSRSGRGRVVIAGRGAMQRRGISPRPGIKPRKFDEQIVNKDTRPIQRLMDKEIKSAANKAF